MPPPTGPPDHSSHDPQLPFYGPGALACWYLTLACVLLTWTLHPAKSFARLRLTPDIALYTLYACLAAGHAAVQASRFSADDIAQITGAGARPLGWLDALSGYRDAEPELGEEVKGRLLGLNVAFRVGVYFFWTGAWVLLGVFKARAIWPLEMKGVRRREKGLPWLMAVAEGWVVGCFGYVMTRVGFGAVVGAFFEYSFFMGCFIVASAAAGLFFLYLTVAGFAVLRYWVWVEMGVFWSQYRVNRVVDYSSLGMVGYVSFLNVATFLWAGVAMWVLYYTVPLWGFPDLGVSMTGLDQILALGTGLVALAFVSSSVVRARVGNWKGFYVWLKAESKAE